ncbi:hypothetical protein QNI16_30950 [Cytophagaceae bacterium YF14B1]|uniref:Glycosyltransferase n=1 Tax=Xanthocytophaga flava TaxID=3048013 RepID=A0AAE3QY84_9BACT|nr:hypothetical protein [Xanthocytophaga flavus]MDJ1484959.1 hypothetical protein [Xanthocytophaga flavus]
MTNPRLLYISINDGSDTRINKEVKTLSSQFDITYIGIGKSTEQSFVKEYCRQFLVVKGHHKSPFVFLKYYLLFLRAFLFRSYQSIHVINENLLLIFFPFLWWSRKKIVLDVFDSIFLRAKNKNTWLESLCYKTPKVIIVTDDNRKQLLPTPFHAKTVVVENYPYRFREEVQKISTPDELLVFYNGSMSKVRGTELLLQLLRLDSGLKVKMAGWVYDEMTKELSQHPQVEFLGVLPQRTTMQVASQCDYILSLYEPVNENNINASPNKIYDAIQAGTPVIINQEVKISSFVKEHNLGYIMSSFYDSDYKQILDNWLRLKKNYVFDTQLLEQFTWEAVEDKLLKAHQSRME